MFWLRDRLKEFCQCLMKLNQKWFTGQTMVINKGRRNKTLSEVEPGRTIHKSHLSIPEKYVPKKSLFHKKSDAYSWSLSNTMRLDISHYKIFTNAIKKSYLRGCILSNKIVCFSSMVFFPVLIFFVFLFSQML